MPQDDRRDENKMNDELDEFIAWGEAREAEEAATRARQAASYRNRAPIEDLGPEEPEEPEDVADFEEPEGFEDEADFDDQADFEEPEDEADLTGAAVDGAHGLAGRDPLVEPELDDPLVEPELEPDGGLDGSPGSRAADSLPDAPADPEPGRTADEKKTGEAAPAAPGLKLIDWSRDWSLAHAPVPFLAKPLLEKGCIVALVAPSKVGKSLLALELGAAIATGRPVLTDSDVRPPRRVLYLDYENNPSDVLKRLLAMGYEESDLANLMYSCFPDLPPLGSRAGAQALLAVVDRLQPDLVVIDTLVRAVDGDENDSRTITDFYRETLLPLKQRGIAVLRLDHTGRNAAHGARGSSAKNDDVDAVWRLETVGDEDLLLTCTHSRAEISVRQLALRRQRAPLRHRVLHGSEEKLVRKGSEVSATEAMRTLLDEVGVPPEAGRPTAERMLLEKGQSFYKPVLEAAIRERKAAWRRRPA